MFLNMARTATRPSLPASGGVCPWERRPNGNRTSHLVETFTLALRLRLRVGPRADEFVGGESPLLFALSLRLPGTAII